MTKIINVGVNIRIRREQLGMEAASLAAKCNVTPGMISHIEAGLKAPSMTILKSLADALSCSTDALMRNVVEI